MHAMVLEPYPLADVVEGAEGVPGLKPEPGDGATPPERRELSCQGGGSLRQLTSPHTHQHTNDTVLH